MKEILVENRVKRGCARQRDVNEYLTALTPLGNPQTGESSGSVNSQAEFNIIICMQAIVNNSEKEKCICM